MLTKEIILQFLRENNEFIRMHYNISNIGLFGSFARNEQNSESDIDILVEMNHSGSGIFDKKWELREFLQKKFNREIDICNVKHIKPYAKDYILKDAIYA